MDTQLEARLIELETRVAFQDDTIVKLQALVKVHQKELYHLTQRYDSLRESVGTLQNASRGEEQIPDEVPPHY